MTRLIKKNITWVGRKDGDLQAFHGLQFPTNEGFSYNSYLVREEKIALIDTVWAPYAQEFVANLEREIELQKIDFIIACHAEIDSSGALPALMERIPDTPIYCTAHGVDSLKGHFHQDWNFQVVRTGDTLDLGNNKQLLFIETPMLHWPDSMMTYLVGDGVLFSSDAFGQHFSSKQIFNDLVDQSALYRESLKYYANTFAPFNRGVTNKINEILVSDLPINMICPSQGVIWRNNPAQIIDQYLAWADAYQENRITLIFDTKQRSTQKMAEAIRTGIEVTDRSVETKIVNLADADNEEVLTDVFRSKGILIGSPTINAGMLPRVAALLEQIGGFHLQGKRAAAFGSYGWSGEAVDKIGERLEEAGFSTCPGIQTPWQPNDEALEACQKYGRDIATQWSAKPEVAARKTEDADPGTGSPEDSAAYKCWACAWVYDPAKGIPEQGIPAGTSWEDLPDSMCCPICFLNKQGFDPVDSSDLERSLSASPEV